jgi:hypothetical protein
MLIFCNPTTEVEGRWATFLFPNTSVREYFFQIIANKTFLGNTTYSFDRSSFSEAVGLQ